MQGVSTAPLRWPSHAPIGTPESCHKSLLSEEADLMRLQDARGDQCDKCGRLLNPTDLVNPKCKLTGTTPVLRSTKHIFLDLPALTPQLQAYIDQVSKLGGWSANCVQVRAPTDHMGPHHVSMAVGTQAHARQTHGGLSASAAITAAQLLTMRGQPNR